MARFTTALCPLKTKWDSGYAGGANLNLHALADEALGGPVLGEWLTCYMLRRFGFPNAGSDGYKNLCSWMVTTPIAGLFLLVTPYLGSATNLHFAVRFTKEVGAKIERDPGREAYLRRRDQALRAWWRKTGNKLYALGMGKKVGDEDELVSLYGENDKGEVGGLWRRPLKVDRPREPLPKGDGMLMWWIGDFVAKSHPEVELPAKMTAAELSRRETPFARKARAAIKRAMVDLLRPAQVRDISFGVFGRGVDGTRGPAADPHESAGYAAEYWFSPRAKRERAKAKT